MAHIKIELNKETNEVKLEIKDLNPVEVMKLALGICQDAIARIHTEPKSNIIKPNAQDTIKVNQEVN